MAICHRSTALTTIIIVVDPAARLLHADDMDASSSIERLLHLPPRWVLLLAFAVDLGVSGWRTTTSAGVHGPGFFLLSLVWPGVAVLLAVYVFAWLGWALEID